MEITIVHQGKALKIKGSFNIVGDIDVLSHIRRAIGKRYEKWEPVNDPNSEPCNMMTVQVVDFDRGRPEPRKTYEEIVTLRPNWPAE